MNAQNVYPMPTDPGPDEIRTEVVEVTPRTAAEWLTLNRRNRRARTLLVSKYAADMAAGQWRMAGEPIKFDTSGNLLDGQHRLSAVMLSGATVTMLVVRGLPPESQAVMDSGSARTAGDQLGMLGYARNPQTLAAAARLVLLWNRGYLFKSTKAQIVTNSDILAFVDANPDRTDAVEVGMRVHRRVRSGPGATCAAVFLTTRSAPAESGQFWASVRDDATFASGSPIQAMLNRFGEARRAGAAVTPAQSFSAQIRTWNAWREGRSLQRTQMLREGKVIRFEYVA